MVKIYESSFEKSHWTGVKPADLHVFLASGCVQGMQAQLIHCVQMYLLVEKPNIWQAAQSHILVEQTHTHIFQRSIFHYYIRIYTSIAARGGGGSFKRLKLYNSEEHVPIESFVTTLIH